ncbi:MAG: c-type cytochrome [Gemmatimonadales bacterium]
MSPPLGTAAQRPFAAASVSGLAAVFAMALAIVIAVSACGPPARPDMGHDAAARPPAVNDSIDASVVPPDSAIPHDSLGASMRRGLALLAHTGDSLPGYVGANLRCLSCHLDGGRRPLFSLVGSFARYPRFVERSGAVATIEDRINFCFTRSLAGRALPTGSREMHDMVSYFAFLSSHVPPGAHVRGEGTPRIATLTGDSARGSSLYGAHCARCHVADGTGTAVAPAVWGPRSFTIAAGMARELRLASFIRHAMPFDRPGTLSDQDAYDLAAFVMSHPRPDLPGKSRDWPAGGAPPDVPYATTGHQAFHPAPLIARTGDTLGMIVPLPVTLLRIPAAR